MSWPVTTIHCDRCDFRTNTCCTWDVFEYLLPDGVRLPMSPHLGWCEDCDSVAPVENLATARWRQKLDTAAMGLAHLQPPPALPPWWRWKARREARDRLRRWHSESSELLGQIGDASDALALLAERRRPPRCLRCGSERVIAPLFPNRDGNEDEPTHPGCGGTLHMDMDDEFRIALVPTVRRYSPEGDPLDVERVAGYGAPRAEFYESRQEANASRRAARPVDDWSIFR